MVTAPLDSALVVAGAGSGKTETMSLRVAWLVGTGQVRADEVLGLTFTRKAAGELAERVTRAVERMQAWAAAGPGASGGGRAPVLQERPQARTYHSFAADLVSAHAALLHLDEVRLLGEAAAHQLVDRVVRGWAHPLDVGMEPRAVAAAVLALAGECAEHRVGTDRLGDVLDEHLRVLAQQQDAGLLATKPQRDVLESLERRRALVPLLAAYTARKRDAGLLDHGDQVLLAAEVAAAPGVAAELRAEHRVVFLDEYQDTSAVQTDLLATLFGDGHPVTAVGDPHQSIFGWRGASSGTLGRFLRRFSSVHGGPPAQYTLSTSWRNPRLVLDVANRWPPTSGRPARRPAGSRSASSTRPRPPCPARCGPPTSRPWRTRRTWWRAGCGSGARPRSTAGCPPRPCCAADGARWRASRTPCTRRASRSSSSASAGSSTSPRSSTSSPCSPPPPTPPAATRWCGCSPARAGPSPPGTWTRCTTGRASRRGRPGRHLAGRRARPAAPARLGVARADAGSATPGASGAGRCRRCSAGCGRACTGRSSTWSSPPSRRPGPTSRCSPPRRTRGRPAGCSTASSPRPPATWTSTARPPWPGSSPGWTPPARTSAGSRSSTSSPTRARCRSSPSTPPRAWSGTTSPSSTSSPAGSRSARPPARRAAAGSPAPASCPGRPAATPTPCPSGASRARCPRRTPGAGGTSSGPRPGCTQPRRSGGWPTSPSRVRDARCSPPGRGGGTAAARGRRRRSSWRRARSGCPLLGWHEPEPPADGSSEVNPREVPERRMPWPAPLPTAVERVRAAAEAVRAARAELAAAPVPTAGGAGADGAAGVVDADGPGADGPSGVTASWERLVDALLAERARTAAPEVPVHLSASEAVAVAVDPAAALADLARPVPRRPSRQARRGSRFHEWVEARSGPRHGLFEPEEPFGAADDAAADDAELALLKSRFEASGWADARWWRSRCPSRPRSTCRRAAWSCAAGWTRSSARPTRASSSTSSTGRPAARRPPPRPGAGRAAPSTPRRLAAARPAARARRRGVLVRQRRPRRAHPAARAAARRGRARRVAGPLHGGGAGAGPVTA